MTDAVDATQLAFPNGCDYATEFERAYGVDVNAMNQFEFLKFVNEVATGILTKRSGIYAQYANVLWTVRQSGAFTLAMEAGLARLMLARLVDQAKRGDYETDSDADQAIAIESVARYFGGIPIDAAMVMLLELGDLVVTNRYFYHQDRDGEYPSALHGFVLGVFDGLLTFRRLDAAEYREDRLADSIPLFQAWEQEMVDAQCTDPAIGRLRELIAFNPATDD